jgi:hypothetical protein
VLVPPSTEDPSLLFRVQTVLAGDLKLHSVELGVVEPPWNKRRAVEKAAVVHLFEDVHSDLIEEIVRRERINQEDTIVVADEGDDWTTKGESSDEEEEEDSND